jgi:hypothetical protein
VSIPSGGNFSEVTRLKLAVFDVRDRDKEEVLKFCSDCHLWQCDLVTNCKLESHSFESN